MISTAEVQRCAPDVVLGRVGSLELAVYTLASCGGALGGAWVVDATGPHWLAGLATLVPAVMLWVVLWKGLPRLQRDLLVPTSAVA